MKVPLKVLYACQVLAQLGRTYGQSSLPHIEVLAEAESVPANYLVQILNELRTSGLVVSRRGKQGGYALRVPPEQITLAAVMEAVDGSVLMVPDTTNGEHAQAVAQIWKGMQATLKKQAENVTVADLMRPNQVAMWHI